VPRICRFADRLTYANVAATIALFVALGGTSYAVVTLPANSVGSRQLQPGAVTPSRLGFPLAVAHTTDERREDLMQGGCNGGGWAPGEPAPPCVPPHVGGATPHRTVTVHLRFAARLIASAVLAVEKQGTPATYAEVRTALLVDARPTTQSTTTGELTTATTIRGGQTLQVPLQAVVSVPAGTHTIGVYDQAEYFGSGPGDVVIGPISLIVSALPA
jgi:hypothetical protein